LAGEFVQDAINRHGIAERTIVSSFDYKVTNVMKLVPDRQYKVIQLLNYDGEEDDCVTPQGMEGINVDLHYLK